MSLFEYHELRPAIGDHFLVGLRLRSGIGSRALAIFGGGIIRVVSCTWYLVCVFVCLVFVCYSGASFVMNRNK